MNAKKIDDKSGTRSKLGRANTQSIFVSDWRSVRALVKCKFFNVCIIRQMQMNGCRVSDSEPLVFF